MEGFEKPRLKSLLDHFAEVEDFRESWRVAHLFLPKPTQIMIKAMAGSKQEQPMYVMMLRGLNEKSFLT